MGATKKLMMKLSAKQTTPGLAYRYTVVVTKIAQARQNHQYMMALYLKIGADNRTRTCTGFRPQPPQGCAYTNFAISAYGGDDRSRTCTPFGNKVWAYRVLPFRHVPINFGADEGSRTLTPVKALVSEASVYYQFHHICIWCRRRDSNPHFTLFKSANSTNWPTSAYIKVFELQKEKDNPCQEKL